MSLGEPFRAMGVGSVARLQNQEDTSITGQFSTSFIFRDRDLSLSTAPV